MFTTFAWYFLSLEGRISRQEFRLGYFGLVIVNALLIRTWRNLTVPRVRYYSGHDISHDWSILLVLLVLLWPLIAVTVKRLHDLNVSGWWLLAALATPVISSVTSVSGWIITLLAVAVLSVLPGASGDNRFGRDPLAQGGI
ncbi:DUF805 domain-containing protein [Bradyrhizobium sp. AZCC 1719]|uniref:DUF805 domain-containing protein n=1 Tax=Bradyrhizobium sp. AZCC 1719 TaxID=3117028 RepID=UPI002FF230DB